MSSSLNDITYVQGEIEAAERRIKQEIERLCSLAKFRDLFVDIRVFTERRLNEVEKVDRVDVKIRAVL